MRPTLSIFAAIACASAFSASTSLSSANDYLFTIPFTTNITGNVMGDSGDGSAMSAEDLCWLHEALAERFALSHPGSYDHSVTNDLVCEREETGTWGLSETNDCIRFVTAVSNIWDAVNRERTPVTNIILKVVTHTNKWCNTEPDPKSFGPTWPSPRIQEAVFRSSLLDGRFVSTNADVISYPTALPEGFGLYDSSTRTDVVERISADVRLTNAIESVITQNMTNGTTNAHTNLVPSWVTNSVDRIFTTNVVSFALEDAISATNRLSYEIFVDRPLRGWYDKSDVVNAFADMRRCTRTVVRSCFWTNTSYTIEDRWNSRSFDIKDGTGWSSESGWIPAELEKYDIEDGYEFESPGSTHAGATFDVRVLRTVSSYAALDSENGASNYRVSDTDSGWYDDYSCERPSMSIFFDTGIRRSTESAGRGGRISANGSRFFAVCVVDGRTETYDEDSTTVENALTNRLCVVPVSAEISDISSNVVFELGVDFTTIPDTVASLFNLSIPSGYGDVTAPSYPSAPVAPSSSSGPSQVVYRSRTTFFGYTISILDVIGLLRINPSTRLDGWE